MSHSEPVNNNVARAQRSETDGNAYLEVLSLSDGPSCFFFLEEAAVISSVCAFACVGTYGAEICKQFRSTAWYHVDRAVSSRTSMCTAPVASHRRRHLLCAELRTVFVYCTLVMVHIARGKHASHTHLCGRRNDKEIDLALQLWQALGQVIPKVVRERLELGQLGRQWPVVLRVEVGRILPDPWREVGLLQTARGIEELDTFSKHGFEKQGR